MLSKPQVESSKPNFNSEVSANIPHSPTSDEEYLSDYIQNHRVPLPHLGADDSLSRPNTDDGFKSLEEANNGHNADGDDAAEQWQKNWVFKKRDQNVDNDDTNSTNDLVTISNSNSIGMLVPSPTEEVKALIGDQTADEVSDLSEMGSGDESELSDDEQQATNHLDIPHVIAESNTLIGGKNAVGSFHQTLLLSPASLTVVEVSPVAIATDYDVEIETNSDAIPLNSEEVQHLLETLGDVVTNSQIPEEKETIPFPVPAPRYLKHLVHSAFV